MSWRFCIAFQLFVTSSVVDCQCFLGCRKCGFDHVEQILLCLSMHLEEVIRWDFEERLLSVGRDPSLRSSCCLISVNTSHWSNIPGLVLSFCYPCPILEGTDVVNITQHSTNVRIISYDMHTFTELLDVGRLVSIVTEEFVSALVECGTAAA